MRLPLGFLTLGIRILTFGRCALRFGRLKKVSLFYVIFFAVGALAVGALRLSGAVDTAWVEWLLFPVIALITLRLFRQPLLGRLKLNERPDEVDSLVGQVAVAMSDIAPGQ